MASKPFFDARPGRGAWRLKYRPDPSGPWVTVTLCKHPTDWSPGRPPKRPPQEAIDRAREFSEVEYRAKHGIGPAPVRAVVLSEYMAAYLETYRATKDEGSVVQLARGIRRFEAFAAARGVTTVQGVNRPLCRDYLEMRIREVVHATVRTERGFIMPIWSRAVVDGLVTANPWTGAKVPGKASEPTETYWTAEQVEAIARHCAKPWQRDLVLTLANTGLRISAALALRRDWIDFDRGTLTVPASHDKAGRGYTLALSRGARAVLERRAVKGASGLVFPNPRTGGLVPYDSARDAIDRAIQKAGVPRGTPHSLRHSYGRMLAERGVPMQVIRAQLGHSTSRMTERYTRLSESHASKYMENFGIGDDDQTT